MDLPWSAFDLAEIALYQGDLPGSRSWLERGIAACTAANHPATFRQSLELVKKGGVLLNGLDETLATLAEAETWFPG